MWDTPFSPEFLDAKDGVVIRCPEEFLSYELFELLKHKGAEWVSGRRMEDTAWDGYCSNTAYFIKDKRISFGTYRYANTEEWKNYIKCTFYGVQDEEFEVADDENLFDFLGIK